MSYSKTKNSSAVKSNIGSDKKYTDIKDELDQLQKRNQDLLERNSQLKNKFQDIQDSIHKQKFI